MMTILHIHNVYDYPFIQSVRKYLFVRECSRVRTYVESFELGGLVQDSNSRTRTIIS